MATVLKLDGTTPMPSKLSPLSSPSKSQSAESSLSFTDFQLTPTESLRSLSYSPASRAIDASQLQPTPMADGLEKLSLSLDLEPQITPNCKSSFVFTEHALEHLDAFELEDDEADDAECLSYKIDLGTGDNKDDDDEDDENPFLLGLAIDIPATAASTLSRFAEFPEIESCDEDFSYSAHYSVDAAEHDWLSESAHVCMDDAERSDSVDRSFVMKKYQYIENIGIGAFGIVDKVLHLARNRFMAIKQSRSIGEEVLRQFRNETRFLREFADCAHVIDLLDFGRNVDANQICLGLEYMDVGSLCNVASLSMAQLQYIAVRVLGALQALHAKLVVHNDVKPDNILVSSDGAVKLIDFGCALRMKAPDAPLTKSIGSIRYLAFEKRFVSPIRYTTKSDVYSLGVTLSELFNGEHVKSRASTPYDHYFVTASPTLKASRPRHAEFDDFIARCMHQDPQQRWSATQLLAHPFLESAPSAMRFSRS